MKLERSFGREIAESQSDRTYQLIRVEILSGVLAPSARLKIQDLATRLEVSPGAVREALSRLLSEHLVIAQSQRGFAVAPISFDDLEDLTNMRCDIETLALQKSILLGGRDWEARVLAAAHMLHGAPMIECVENPLLSPEWVVAHGQFHHALVSACGSRRLLNMHTLLYEQSERYRDRSAFITSDRKVADEHKELLDLALKRDAKALCGKMTMHIRTTTQAVIDKAKREE